MSSLEQKEENFLSEFFHIITIGRKANTYKFALARSILEFVKENEIQIIKNIEQSKDTAINYSELADDFFRYYWHQVKFKIPQNFNVDFTPNAVNILQDLFELKQQPEKFEMVDQDLKKKAIEDILREVFGKGDKSQVVPKFQKLMHGNKATLKETFYRNDAKNKRILVNPEAMNFFIHYRILLEKFVILEWAKFVDKIKTAPGIISKIEDPEFDRTSLKKDERKLRKFYKCCFYCERNLDELPTDIKIHVDHFIPRSYVGEDELWNLVLSCSECNLNKSDSLAPDFMNLLKENIKKHISDFDDLKKSIRNLSETVWEQEIERIYKNCLDYGFTEICKVDILKRKK